VADAPRFGAAEDMRLKTVGLSYPKTVQAVLKRLETYAAAEVSKEISGTDEMFAEGDPTHYFAAGQSAINAIAQAMLLSGMTDPRTVLDMACGHGRVIRHLRVFFPEARLVACDVCRSGVDFCTETFNVEGIYSSDRLAEVTFDCSFDVVWCGSLLTHLPERRFRECLGLLLDTLSNRGILVATTVGRFAVWVQENLGMYMAGDRFAPAGRSFAEAGFGFASYPDTDSFGIALSSPSNTLGVVEGRRDVRVLGYQERGWDDHQDVLILARSSIDTPPGAAPYPSSLVARDAS